MFPTRLTIVKNVLRWLPNTPLRFLTLSATVIEWHAVRPADQKPDKEFILTLVRKYLRVLERYPGFPRYCSTPKVVPRRNVGVLRRHPVPRISLSFQGPRLLVGSWRHRARIDITLMFHNTGNAVRKRWRTSPRCPFTKRQHRSSLVMTINMTGECQNGRNS
jgi:hypothetical protein